MSLFLLLSFSFLGFAQRLRPDTIIKQKAYTSYYSYRLHEPLYVVYRLHNGGGECDRKSFNFKTGGLPFSATSNDYKGSGYDKGHLADAEDFAYDCELDESTFRYYNCLPQTPKLNRGIWKQFETVIRKDSQLDSLRIACGGIFGNKKMGPDSIAVPDYCWKIVWSLTTQKVTYCLLFPNDGSDTFQRLSLKELKAKLGYSLDY